MICVQNRIVQFRLCTAIKLILFVVCISTKCRSLALIAIVEKSINGPTNHVFVKPRSYNTLCLVTRAKTKRSMTAPTRLYGQNNDIQLYETNHTIHENGYLQQNNGEINLQKLSRRTNSIDIPYESTITALRAYHIVHGNLVMPRRYIVPVDQGFPLEWVGLDLAGTVYNMKWWKKNICTEETRRVNELNSLGFVWERLQPEWNVVLEALITYHSFNGHVLVPNKFMIPYGSDQWPKATWGIPLGNCVYRIRSRDDFLHGSTSISRRNQLGSLNFVWDFHEHRFLKFFAVLRHYAKLTKTGKFSPAGSHVRPLKVPASYFVPENDIRWPKELWNYQLGAKTVAVRQKQLYVKDKPSRLRMLEDLGFQSCGNAELAWLKVVHAAAIYSRLNSHSLDVPYKFKVPEPSPEFVRSCGAGTEEEWPWPQYLWGLPLGQRIKDIRITGAYLKGKDKLDRIRQLDALGFIWDVREHRRHQKLHRTKVPIEMELTFHEASS
jgi:hypothetical protein